MTNGIRSRSLQMGIFIDTGGSINLTLFYMLGYAMVYYMYVILGYVMLWYIIYQSQICAFKKVLVCMKHINMIICTI